MKIQMCIKYTYWRWAFTGQVLFNFEISFFDFRVDENMSLESPMCIS